MYRFVPVNTEKENIRQYVRLLSLVFAKPKLFTEEYILWGYEKNPEGKILGFDAFAGEELAAHYVLQPIRAKVNGKEKRGLLSLNTATHPQHQGNKLFVQLAERSYEIAANNGFEFVIGVANQNSTHGFIKKLGFQLAGPLEAKTGFGFPFFKEEKKENSFERIWSNKLLGWRIANPSAKYFFSSGRILVRAKPGIAVLLGMIEKELTEPLAVLEIKKPFMPLKVWLGTDQNINWKKSLYRDIPSFLRPSPLNLIFKDLSGKNSTMDFARIKFHAIDFDAY